MSINTTPQALFGPGILWVTRTDIDNATPVNIGYVNEFSIDMSFDVKQLYGQKQFPLVVARGQAKCDGKIKAATLSGQALNTVLIGQTWAAGTQYDATTVTTTVATESPYTYTPTVPSSGTFDTDLGVVFSTTNLPLTKVASGTTPTTGQYAQTGGTYTFAASDGGQIVKTSFAYKMTSASGQSLALANADIGTTPTFQVDYKTTLYGSTYYVRLFNSVGSKESLAHKIDDFAMPEYDFSFFANVAGQVGIISLATQA